MGNERCLNCFPHAKVNGTVSLGGCRNEVGDHHHGDFVSDDQAVDASAIGFATCEMLGLDFNRHGWSGSHCEQTGTETSNGNVLEALEIDLGFNLDSGGRLVNCCGDIGK